MSIDDFIAELEVSLNGCERGTLSPECRFRELPFWDSLAVLVTLAVVDSCYKRQISSDDLIKCETIGDIYRMVSS